MTELPEAVGAILDARPDPGLPEPVAQVDSFRSAARRIVEDERLDPETKTRLVVLLLHMTERAVLGEWCRRAILREFWEWRFPEESFPVPPLRRDAAMRVLLRAGYASCPACLRPFLTDEVELRRSANRRRWNTEAAAVREKAVWT